MSTSSLRPASSHHRRPSSVRNQRTCDYGDEHVKRSKLEEVEEELVREQGKRKREKEEWETAASDYHEKLASAQEKLDTTEAKVKDIQDQLSRKTKYAEDLLSWGKGLEEAVKENAEKVRKNGQLAKEAQTKQEELKRESKALQDQLAELAKRPTSEDLEQERKKVRKLETDLKHLTARFDEQSAARHKGLDLLESARVDLTPILELHPALAKVEDPTPAKLAEALVQNIAFDLNEVWNHLPVPTSEALVTPSTTTIEPLLQKLRRSVSADKQRDEDLERKWKQAELEAQRWKKDWQAAADRENDVTEKLVDVADQVQQWERAAKLLDRGNVLSPYQAENFIRDLQKKAEDALRKVRSLEDQLQLQKAGFKAAGEEVVSQLSEQLRQAERDRTRLDEEVSNLRWERDGLARELGTLEQNLADAQFDQQAPELPELQQAVELLTHLVERLVQYG